MPIRSEREDKMMPHRLITIDSIMDVEKHLDGLDAIIFDLDDTLYSEKEYIQSGFRAIAEHFGEPQFEKELWTAYEQGGRAIDEVLALHGCMDLKQEALQIYRFHDPKIHLYEGVSDMLARLRQIYPIGVITDGRPEGQRAKIRALGLTVDEIIITDELGGVEYRKPNPTAFVLMQEKMGIPFEKMAYVGDNITKDFQAPNELGMACIWFKNSDGLYATNSE